MTNEEAQQPKKKRGFGGMSPERQREIASMGGKTAHAKGVAHQWTKESAKVAGTKGGLSHKRTKKDGDSKAG